MMWFLVLLMLLLASPTELPGPVWQPIVQPINPPDSVDPVTAAMQDCRTLGPNAIYYRWLYIGGNPTPKEAEEWWKALSSHCNRLSREPDIVLPVKVSKDGRLIRINLLEYGWYERRNETWELLNDPYFTYKVRYKAVDGDIEGSSKAKGSEATAQGGLNPRKQIEALQAAGKGYRLVTTQPYTMDGETWTFKVEADGSSSAPKQPESKKPAGTAKANDGTVKIAFAPWFPPEASKELIERTQSRMPIVDGRWFLAQTAIQADRKPGYYDFLGVKNEKDFDKLVGFNEDILKEFPKEAREAVATSTVTLQPRRIDRAGTVGGGYWRTSDPRIAVDDHNPLRVLDDNYKFDARESFGHLPNGMFAWGLFNAKGERQDTAPDFIASDSTSPNTDRRVHVNLSCVRCHTSGVQDIKGWVRSVFQPPFALQAVKPEDLKDLQRKYMTRLETYINQDRQIYADAILQANGLKTEADASLYASKFAAYEAIQVDLNYAARDLEVTPGQFVNGLRNSLFTTGSLDPLLVNFLGPNLPLTIRQWEEVRGLAKVIMLGIAPQN